MAQQTYSISARPNIDEPNFANIIDLEGQRAKQIGAADTAEPQFNFLPGALVLVLSSTYCLIVLCILLIVPILELAIGAAYINQCPINSNIPVYLIVTGVCGIATIILTLTIVS